MRHMKSCKKTSQSAGYQQGSAEYASHPDQGPSSSRRRNDASAYPQHPRGHGSSSPYPMVRHDPLEAHDHILVLSSTIQSHA
jgi:hypothetical protein